MPAPSNTSLRDFVDDLRGALGLLPLYKQWSEPTKCGSGYGAAEALKSKADRNCKRCEGSGYVPTSSSSFDPCVCTGVIYRRSPGPRGKPNPGFVYRRTR